jgi:hypothetical protein
MEEVFKVNKSAKESHIKDELERLKGDIGFMTRSGYRSFKLGINGDHEECWEVCQRLEYYGVFVCERGFDHRGLGPEGHANVNFYIKWNH